MVGILAVIIIITLIASGGLAVLGIRQSKNERTEEKETVADNVHPKDTVPETSFLHSKYWTKYGGNYRLQLTAHNFLEECFRIHTEFEMEQPGFCDLCDEKDTIWVNFYQYVEEKGFKLPAPVLNWGIRPSSSGLITENYFNVWNIQKPAKNHIYEYVDYYKKHKNPLPYGSDYNDYCTKEVRTNQIWIEDLSDFDKVIEVVRQYAKQQKEELFKYAAMFNVLEETQYTEKMEAYKKQISDLNKMRNDFTDKTVDTIFKQINLQGDF